MCVFCKGNLIPAITDYIEKIGNYVVIIKCLCLPPTYKLKVIGKSSLNNSDRFIAKLCQPLTYLYDAKLFYNLFLYNSNS